MAERTTDSDLVLTRVQRSAARESVGICSHGHGVLHTCIRSKTKSLLSIAWIARRQWRSFVFIAEPFLLHHPPPPSSLRGRPRLCISVVVVACCGCPTPAVSSQLIEDKTFGLKNKNKSKSVQVL